MTTTLTSTRWEELVGLRITRTISLKLALAVLPDGLQRTTAKRT